MSPLRLAVLAAGVAVAIGVVVLLWLSLEADTAIEPVDNRVSAPTTSEHPPTSSSLRGQQETATRHSEDSAVAAAADFVIAYDSPVILDPQTRSDLIDATAAVEHQAPLTRTFSEAAEMLQDRLALTADAAEDPEFVWRSIPAGWAVEEYGRSSATVVIWGTGILLADGRSLTELTWTTTTVELVWERDDWRLASFNRTDGPEPPLLGEANGGSAARRINRFAPFSYRPAPAAAGR